MVDYTKWDRLECSSDEDTISEPQVTKFDSPQRVTIPGRTEAGKARCEDSGKTFESAAVRKSEALEEATEEALGEAPEKVPQLWLKNDSSISKELSAAFCAKQGAVTKQYAWTQDKYSVSALIFLPPGVRGSKIELSLTEAGDADRNPAEGSEDGRLLKIQEKCGWSFEGVFPYSVESDEDKYDWEVLTFDPRLAAPDVKAAVSGFMELHYPKEATEMRALRLRTTKRTVAGMSVWWSCFIKGEPKIDLGALPGRVEKTESLQKTWVEAHRQFREKIAMKRKVVIDMDGNGIAETAALVPPTVEKEHN